MVYYGPFICILILMLSGLILLSTRRKWKIQLLSGSAFFLCAFFMWISYRSFSKIQVEQLYLGHVFMLNALNLVLAFTFMIVNMLIIWFSYYAIHKYMDETAFNPYYGSLLVMNAFITMILFLDDTRWLYGAYFLVILMSYNLIKIKVNNAVQYEKTKFIVLNLFGLLLLAVGFMMLKELSGTTRIHLLRDYINLERLNYLTLSVTLCIIGLGINGALFPFYSWLPDLYSAMPATLSAHLSSITIKVGPIIMMKILYDGLGSMWFSEIEIDRVLVVLGGLSMLTGSLFAIYQRDIKKMIAYSTISQLGYIYLGMGLANSLGIQIAIYQIIAHTITKSAIYLSVSSIYEQAGTTIIEDLKGIGKEMPVTLMCFTMAALSMIGIPLLPGFINKWYMSLSAIANGSVVPVFIILISTILNATYYLPIIINGYYGKHNVSDKVFLSKAKPLKEVVPLIILVVMMVLLGIFSNEYFDINPVHYYF
ncbi:complex I subunit 5 family protein [Fusibacter ferrireducens]|uniref:NADH:quinone oxidoreductase/Mrp antiporter transmembrane domain-containing protein n=1 Tax=Fusibacter ferrireducens TaxID=2785058 RepID=A0ABR9ZUL9_9FIRM|nr:proton-conducting transporter membrane subunit [Fusibacter ferrireducens]MBF4694133.1 hypothetical protein [Fusibacter ferrireducens]